MILPINHVADWRYIRQSKQAQIDKDVICENTTIIDHDYVLGDKVITLNKLAYKQETPFRGPYKKNSNLEKRNCHLKNECGNNENKYPQHQAL